MSPNTNQAFKYHSLSELANCWWPSASLGTTIYASFNGYLQQENTPCHKTHISNCVYDHEWEVSELPWPPWLPELSPTEHLLIDGIFVAWKCSQKIVQQIHDAIMSTWTRISGLRKSPAHCWVMNNSHSESKTSRIRNVFLMKWPVSVHYN